MEKEITKNRQATEMTLITAVNDIIEESGFERLGDQCGSSQRA